MKIKPKIPSDIVGKIPSLGITKYIRNGTVVTRSSSSCTGKKYTRKQFAQRMRMCHSIALWKELRPYIPLFTKEGTTYLQFISLALQLPTVFLPKNDNITLLIPGIPVSSGTLQPIGQQLGTVDGTPALVTDLKAGNLHPYAAFLLYTAEQLLYSTDRPYVKFHVREVRLDEFVTADGCLALKDDAFADEKKGWALVQLIGKNCSTQSIVTRCTLYERFTTEEALKNKSTYELIYSKKVYLRGD